jgi:succinyl-CoA synthetase beta subunit
LFYNARVVPAHHAVRRRDIFVSAARGEALRPKKELSMKLHEYQAKERLAVAGVPVQAGLVAEKAAQVPAILKKLGKGPWVIKAQAHTGGRGKGGGIKLVKTPKEAVEAAKKIIGMTLVTHQTGPAGLPVRKVLVCKAVDLEREIYAAVVMNRKAGKPTLMVSAEGGMDIESLAVTAPEKILRIDIDPNRGLEGFQARRAALFAGLTGDLFGPAVKLFQGLARTFLSLDANLVEINPLAVVKAKGGKKELLAVDAKITTDDNAEFRHGDLYQENDASDLSAAEKRAHKVGIAYIQLDGTIGCLVNGAGLAMGTMDIIKLHGGEPANFLDVGGGANVEQVTEAFKIILSDKKVKAVLVNIFGGIMKCDVIAQGVIEAVKKVGLNRPLVVRLEGNRVEEGRKLLASSGLKLVAATDLTDAAKKAVAAAQAA